MLDEIAKLLLAILPPDGAVITNRAARAVLSQKLGRAISNEEYFSARDALLHAGKIGRVRGQGGSVFLLSEKAEPDPPPDSPNETPRTDEEPRSIIPERDLMFATQRALVTQFPSELDLPKGAPDPIVENISTTGPKTGIWARPDFVLVCVSRYSILPGAHVETHVFELKNELGGGVRAVHEALAQGRFANFAHLVWFIPDGSPREAELEGVAAHCALHGVGLIRMRLLPNQEAELEVIVDARRTPTTPLEVDGFLEARLSDVGKHQLAAAIRRSKD